MRPPVARWHRKVAQEEKKSAAVRPSGAGMHFRPWLSTFSFALRGTSCDAARCYMACTPLLSFSPSASALAHSHRLTAGKGVEVGVASASYCIGPAAVTMHGDERAVAAQTDPGTSSHEKGEMNAQRVHRNARRDDRGGEDGNAVRRLRGAQPGDERRGREEATDGA